MLFHSSTANRSKNIAQCFVSVLLCLMIFFNSITVAHAASLGGWSLGPSSVSGASVILNASREVILNGAKKIVNGTAKITPPPASVAKVLAGGAAAVALDLAVKELLGGVDYVLDPANNSINYKKPQSSTPSCTINGVSCSNYCSTQAKATNRSDGGAVQYTDSYYGTRWYCQTTDRFRYAVIPGAQTTTPDQTDNQPKSLPLSTVAQKVIDQAAAGSPQAQHAIKAAADTIVAEAETDSTKARPIINQFEKTSTIETSEKSTSKSESTTTTNTANPEQTNTKTDTSTEFPVFCSWAPTICEAASVVTYQTKLWAQDIADYFKEEPQQEEDNTVDIDQSIPEITNKPRVSIGTDQCPSVPMNFDLGIVSIPIDLSPVWLCEIAEGVKPFFIALGFYFASNIVGRRQQ